MDLLQKPEQAHWQAKAWLKWQRSQRKSDYVKYMYTDKDFSTAFAEGVYFFTSEGCTKEWHPKLNRATWSVVVADSDGQHLAACTGPVWAHNPQTSPTGEFCGFAAVCHLAKEAASNSLLITKVWSQP